MTALAWPLVVLLLGSGALALAYRWLEREKSIEALVRAMRDLQAGAITSADAAGRIADEAMVVARAAKKACDDLNAARERESLAKIRGR